MELPEFPNQFHPEMQLGLRLALMQFVVSAINEDLMSNTKSIIDQLINQNKSLDRPSAFLLASNEIEKRTKPYKDYIRDHGNMLNTTFQNALRLEQAGFPDAAIFLYEELADNGFTAPMPHDRLRILYSNKFEFEKAIHACERYITILRAYNEFDPTFSNAHLIPNYLKYISKLSGKLSTNKQ